jgi:predicted GNAT superfamily acetyltransferase
MGGYVKTAPTGAFHSENQEVPMAFSYTNKRGVTYFLHSRVTVLKSGKSQTLFFFAKEQKAGVLEAVPAGYKVSETTNGLPVLKKA